MENMPVPELSIILPVFNEAETVHGLIGRLDALVSTLAFSVEVVFVNDGSRDDTEVTLLAAIAGKPGMRLISLSRNFGHQMAVSCGMAEARGSAVAVLDADLQDPPELISEMHEKWRSGSDVVIARRRSRKGESWFKLFTAKCFYRGLARMTDVPIELDAGDFYLLDRQVVEVLNRCPEHSRFLRGLVAWAGFRRAVVLYDRQPRRFGRSNYTLGKMWRLAKDALFGFSTTPIAFIHILSVASLSVALAVVIVALVTHFAGLGVPGWATLVVLVALFGGLVLLSIGIVAEYVYRIFLETQGRPIYVIRRDADRQAAVREVTAGGRTSRSAPR